MAHTAAHRLRSRLRRLGPLLALSFPGLVAVGVMAVVLTVSLRDAGVDQERSEAKVEATLGGRIVVAPRITPELLAGDPAALAKMDAAVRRYILGGPIERVKLWSPDGVIVYSDEPRPIGDRFALDADDREVLASGQPTSDLSDLSEPENRFERPLAPLLEVYTRVRATSGQPMLFEAYKQFDSLAASDSGLLMVVLPALGGGLLLLGLGNLAAAAWFARYVRRRDEQRAAHGTRVAEGVMRDGEAAEAVRDQHDGAVLGDDRRVERRHPVVAHRRRPAVLLHALVLGVLRLPEALPVTGAGVVVAGQDEHGGHALSVREVV